MNQWSVKIITTKLIPNYRQLESKIECNVSPDLTQYTIRAAGVMYRAEQSSLVRENKRNRLVSIHENRELLNLLTIDACSVVYVWDEMDREAVGRDEMSSQRKINPKIPIPQLNFP